MTLGLIRAREPTILSEEHRDMRREIAEGLKAVWLMPLLRASAFAMLIFGLAGGIFRALMVFYMSRSLGFNPGILGTIWAIGGVSSFIGMAIAPRITRRMGSGPSRLNRWRSNAGSNDTGPMVPALFSNRALEAVSQRS
jgi:Na+/melibiose symporter-like transporter